SQPRSTRPSPGRSGLPQFWLEIQQGPDEEGHCSGDGRTAAGIWPLLARGFGYILYVVPGAVCTTARWTCQALFHVRAKPHWAYAPHVPKEQTLAAQEAPTRIIRWWARRPPGGDAPGRSRAARPVSAADATSPGSTHTVRQPNARYAATPAGSSRAAAGRSAAGAGPHHPHGAGPL